MTGFLRTSIVAATLSATLLAAPAALAARSQCSDGIDNDSDGRVDYPVDNDCDSIDDNNEYVDTGVFVTLTDQREIITAGEADVYVITLRQERDPVKLVDVALHLPFQSSIIYTSDDGTIRDNSVYWGKVAVFRGSVRRLVVHVNTTPYAKGGQLLVARVTADGMVATDTTQMTSERAIPYAQNQLEVRLSDNRQNVMPCETLDYVLSVRNPESRSVAFNIKVPMPKSVRFSDASDGGQYTGSDLVWRTVVLRPLEEKLYTFRVIAKEQLPTHYPIQMVARAGNVVGVDRTMVGGGGIGPDSLLATISDNVTTATRGDLLTYTIRVDNQTGRLDTNASIDASLPRYAEFVSATEGGVWDGYNVRWLHMTVAPGGSREMHMVVRVRSDAPDDAALQATVFVQGFISRDSTRIVSGYTGNPTAYSPLPFYYDRPYRYAAPEGSLLVTVAADQTSAEAGSSISYSVTVRNNGTQAIRDITLKDTYDAGQLTIDDAGGGRNSRGVITWTIDRLEPGDEETFTFDATIRRTLRAGESIVNTAKATAENRDQTVIGSTDADFDEELLQDAYDTEDVIPLENDFNPDEYYTQYDMPRTGPTDFVNPVEDLRKFVNPAKTSAERAEGLFGLLGWMAVAVLGVAGGMTLGKKALN